MEKTILKSRKIAFKPVSSSIADAQVRAEVLHTNSIVQHNLAFLTADHMVPLYKKMFPDSQIAKNI